MRRAAKRTREMSPQLPLSGSAEPLKIGGCSIYAGTCSWADPNFVKEGGFYPRGARSDPRARLEYYATVFPTVEVDATYHALQPAERAAQWVAWTPPQFVFTAKAFALFTWHDTNPSRLPREIFPLVPEHLRDLTAVGAAVLPEEVVNACWDYFSAFVDAFISGGKLGHVLFQFPKGQAYTPELFAYLDRWEPYLRKWPIAVEIRHRSWLEGRARREFLAYLREHQYAYVIPDMIQRAYLPPPDVEVTARSSAIRFHGRSAAMAERRAPTTRVYDYYYKEEELRPWAETVKNLAAEVDRVYLLFNNHFRGQSARNAREIVAMLE